MYNIINRKKHGEELSSEEIDYVVKGYTEGSIPDYQMSALLMAICINGMNDQETFNLTKSMTESGMQLDLSCINNITADKHSTGGVGDKTSLIVGPIVACNGVAVAKMSGRGLGHTGGTIDKLESIEGFKTGITNNEFINQINDIGLSIVAQSAELAPADKKIYALRDVTATVDNIALIASSIMSKKLAAGSKVIVLDVKTGSGAFMKDIEDSKKLADTMIRIGQSANRNMYALISDMNQPLGEYIGNRLEVYEAIEVLKGNGPKDLIESCLYLSALILLGSNKVKTLEEGINLSKDTLLSGDAYNKFKEFVKYQHGNIDFVDNIENYLSVKNIVPIKAVSSGYIKSIDTEKIGLSVQIIGGGREKLEDVIDPNVGMKLISKLGSKVEIDDIIGYLYVNNNTNLDKSINMINEAIVIDKDFVNHKHLYGYFIGTDYHEI